MKNISFLEGTCIYYLFIYLYILCLFYFSIICIFFIYYLFIYLFIDVAVIYSEVLQVAWICQDRLRF